MGLNLGIQGVGAKINWWVHYLILVGFPSLIAYGKHLHLIMGPVNVVLKHMTELPSDRPVSGGDFEMPEDEDLFEAEYGRVGMPNSKTGRSPTGPAGRAGLWDACECCGAVTECGRPLNSRPTKFAPEKGSRYAGLSWPP